MSFSALPFKTFYQQDDVVLAHNAFLLLVKTLWHLFTFFWNVMPLSAFYPSGASQNQLVRSCKLKHVFGFEPPSSNPCSAFCDVSLSQGVAKVQHPFFSFQPPVPF